LVSVFILFPFEVATGAAKHTRRQERRRRQDDVSPKEGAAKVEGVAQA